MEQLNSQLTQQMRSFDLKSIAIASKCKRDCGILSHSVIGQLSVNKMSGQTCAHWSACALSCHRFLVEVGARSGLCSCMR